MFFNLQLNELIGLRYDQVRNGSHYDYIVMKIAFDKKGMRVI